MFQRKALEKIKTHILYSVTPFRKSCRLWDNVEKYCRAGQDTNCNMAHAHCMLDTQGCRQTLRICNTFCFSTATMVARRRPNVTLCVQCLPYSILNVIEPYNIYLYIFVSEQQIIVM